METTHFTTPRTARLVQTAPLTESTRVVYLACHGYGMSVQDFAAWFEVLPKGQVALCPEGLSRFYWKGFSGQPVASWMTSDDRLLEIEDFCLWLDQVYAFAKREAPIAKLVLLGFSQGAATALRWANDRRPAVDAIVVWSGAPPEDLDYAPLEYYTSKLMRSYWGTYDKLVPWDTEVQRFEEVPLVFEHTSFEGGHRILGETLVELSEVIGVG